VVEQYGLNLPNATAATGTIEPILDSVAPFNPVSYTLVTGVWYRVTFNVTVSSSLDLTVSGQLMDVMFSLSATPGGAPGVALYKLLSVPESTTSSSIAGSFLIQGDATYPELCFYADASLASGSVSGQINYLIVEPQA
jgi:hypothetical protein